MNAAMKTKMIDAGHNWKAPKMAAITSGTKTNGIPSLTINTRLNFTQFRPFYRRRAKKCPMLQDIGQEEDLRRNSTSYRVILCKAVGTPSGDQMDDPPK